LEKVCCHCCHHTTGGESKLRKQRQDVATDAAAPS
jgi:hypothetical protein